MFVIKRNGIEEPVDFTKIVEKLNFLANMDPKIDVDTNLVTQKVIASMKSGITTHELDLFAADVAINMNGDYSTLASRILINDLHKSVNLTNQNCDYNRDYFFDYFGIKTLQKSYISSNESPQDMFWRVADFLYPEEEKKIAYDYMSNKYFIHATPTLFNAGRENPQLSSCFLMHLKEDSIDGIYKTLWDCARISKYAGGIGLSIHNLRSRGSDVNGMKGVCTGIVPMLKNFNDTARYVNQGGRRPGSIAVYLQVDHPDIFSFLELKKNTGDENMRCRDLFYAVWIPDLFMKKVQNDEQWCLFCPYKCPGLFDTYGEEYETLYNKYEKEKLYTKQVSAQSLWFEICQSQIETGTPYILYKDSINEKNNQKNLGTIKSSNLCCEVVQYTSKDEIAVCNLASISLPRFVENDVFDFLKLDEVVSFIVKGLNYVIDKNYYPVPEAEYSNKKHRPIGIGVQGLADVYAMLKISFDSEEARNLNKAIFECIYISALKQSCDLAIKDGPYESFEGSPASKGLLQFDLWGVKPHSLSEDLIEELKHNIKLHGLRNSLLVAPMPTASTSQILGNNEAFEPFTSNMYVRRTLAGEFTVFNKHLFRDLKENNLWNESIRNKIIAERGSIQNIEEIPKNIKDVYKTVWEISQKVIIDQASDRGPFIDQTQSMNLFIKRPSVKILSSMHFYSWNKGLKTGIYYLRSQPVSNAINFTVKPQNPTEQEKLECSLKNREACEMCSA